ncbi:uncharacterized protein LOC124622767 [Schistocerca americana]|uniref:uncharacterized protein LOC124622767 n=1 Tax=Schistocerca americana TaxID=7009 RepID=UPI001F5029B6|nr:uncharacterized protein LOC124622767 [Schistocerca americana]
MAKVSPQWKQAKLTAFPKRFKDPMVHTSNRPISLWIFGFLVLLPCISGGTTMNMNMSCVWYPSLDYARVAMECSGPLVTKVPTMLSSDLKLLRLTGTSITSLDSTSFEGRSLAELTTLSVSGGALARVAANAFCPLPALAKLDLSLNQLDHLDALSFKCNKHLRTVNLSDNPSLHHLPLLCVPADPERFNCERLADV